MATNGAVVIAGAAGIFGRFLGNTVSGAASFAAGVALGPALGPIVQDIRNTVNSNYAYVFPDPVILAAGVAQGQVAEKTARLYASYHGFGDDAMTALIDVANTGPSLGLAYDAWRRINPATGKTYLSDAEFTTALKRTGLEPQWFPALLALKSEVLGPADIARAIHKDIIADPGVLAVGQPEGVGKVPAYPLFPIDALAEAAASGYDRDRLGVLVGLQGNPMGAHEAAQALFRGIIDPVDYLRAIAQSNTRNEWGPAIQEQSRAIPSPTNYVEGGIRTRITPAQMYAGTARHGMTQADTDLLFQVHGRPATPHQVFIGLRRGGVYDGPTDQIPAPILQAMRDANLRPEYYNLVYAGLETYPSTMALKAIASAQTISVAETEQILSYEGWNADLAAKVATVWGGGATAGAKPKKLTNATIRSAWKKGNLSEAEALADIQANGLSAADARIYLFATTGTS